MEDLMKLASSQGLGYAMFVCLFIYVLKTTEKREKNYQGTIDKLADKISIVQEIKEDVEEIKIKLK